MLTPNWETPNWETPTQRPQVGDPQLGDPDPETPTGRPPTDPYWRTPNWRTPNWETPTQRPQLKDPQLGDPQPTPTGRPCCQNPTVRPRHGKPRCQNPPRPQVGATQGLRGGRETPKVGGGGVGGARDPQGSHWSRGGGTLPFTHGVWSSTMLMVRLGCQWEMTSTGP